MIAHVEMRKSDTCRCRWVNVHNPLYVKYHDEEWGRPGRADAYLYECWCWSLLWLGYRGNAC